MIKKYHILLSLFLTACSFANKESISIDEKNRYIVYNILWAFEMDYQKSNLIGPLIEIQNSCWWKTFLWYRKCLVSAIRKKQWDLVKNSKEKQFLDDFTRLVEKEIEYYPYYSRFSKMKYPKEFYTIDTWTSKECYIVWTWSFHTTYMWELSESTTDIKLSYWSDSQKILLEIFPLWENAQIYDISSFTWTGYDPWNPCLFRTFWPSYGNIIHVQKIENLTYIFIKNSEWAWSGEFYYVVFVYDWNTNKYINIGSFMSWYGIMPFEYNFNLEKTRNSPLDIYKNTPFLYQSFSESQRIQWDTVESIFSKYIQ